MHYLHVQRNRREIDPRGDIYTRKSHTLVHTVLVECYLVQRRVVVQGDQAAHHVPGTIALPVAIAADALVYFRA